MPTILLLGGTGEARRLASVLQQRYRVISSLAGRVADPTLPAGEVRIGGFGGVEGLAHYLRTEHIDTVVDATHPFAARISANAAAACHRTGTPLLVLRRPGYAVEGHRVPTLAAAAELAPTLGRRIFLTTGRQSLEHFRTTPAWLLLRCVDPPADLPSNVELILDRGPFTVDSELALMTRFAIDVLVTKDSGGPMTAAKLTAAERLAIPVVIVERPPATPGVPVCSTVEEVVARLG